MNDRNIFLLALTIMVFGLVFVLAIGVALRGQP